MEYNVSLVNQSDFEDVYDFADKVKEIRSSGLGVIHDSNGNSQETIPDYLQPIEEYLIKGYEPRFSTVVVIPGEDINNGLHPLRHFFPNLQLPYMKFLEKEWMGDLSSGVKEVADLLKKRHHKYHLTSEEPITLFCLEDFQNNGNLLPELKVSTLDEVIESLPTYHSLFQKYFTTISENTEVDIKAHEINLSGVPDGESWIPQNLKVRRDVHNMVEFGVGDFNYNQNH